MLIRQIGIGSTSTVWEATDSVLQRTVAVKVINEPLNDDTAFIEQFRREAMAAARLSGPGIVAIYDTVRESGIDAVVMEFLTGMPLSDFLSKYAPLQAADTVDLGQQVLVALESAHGEGVIHARLRPETIILCDDRRVKITDTGFRVIAARTSGPYEAPETAAGQEPDSRSDIYSVGTVLYECLTGGLPYESIPQQGQMPLPMSSFGVPVSPALEGAVARSLSVTPEARFQSAAEFGRALGQIDLRRESPPVLPPTGPISEEETGRKLPALLAAGFAALVVLAGIALITTEQGRDAVRGIAEGMGLVDSDASDDGPGAETAAPTPAPTAESGTTSTTLAVGAPIALVAASPFDPPPGSGTEHDELAGFAIDGDGSTVWHSESYATGAFGGLKDGVGLIVVPEEISAITTVDVVSPSQGWSLEIFVADQPAADLAGWGEPVAGANAVAGSAQFDLGGLSAGALLIWVIDLGNAPPPLRIDIAEVTMRSAANR